MKTYLWKINKEKLNRSNLASYSNFVEKNYKVDFGNNFNAIWRWSIANTQFFWKTIWDFTKVKGNLGNTLLHESEVFSENKFFPDSYLNYAENLLRKNDKDPAIIFKSENSYKTVLSWQDLNSKVAKVSHWLKLNGLVWFLILIIFS